MSDKKKVKLVDPAAALRIVDALEKQAARAEDLHLKRILLASGCEIIDRVLEQHSGRAA